MAYTGPSVHVALLDDHTLFREGVRYILHTLPYVESVVDTGDFAQLQAWCRQRLPDVLLLDLQMPGTDGPEAAQQLLAEFPDLKIVVLSMFSVEKFIDQMLKLGVRSYLAKDIDHQQLAVALADVLATGYHYTPAMQQAQAHNGRQPARPVLPPVVGEINFSPRELDVLRLLCQGLTTASIAEQLFLSSRTIEGHRQRLLEKTGTTNAAGLVAYALRYGLYHE